MATRASLRTSVIINTGRDNTNAVTATNAGLDYGLKELSKVYQFDVLRPTVDISFVANDLSVQLPLLNQVVDCRLVDPANPTLAYRMILLRKLQFTGLFPNVPGSPVTGRPYYCYHDPVTRTLYFDKKSSGSYTIRVTFFHLDRFESDTDEPTIPDCEECLIDYATAHVYRSIQMYDDASVWDGRFRQHVGNLVSSVQRQVGNKLVATEWSNQPPIETNVPWLDPFAGINKK